MTRTSPPRCRRIGISATSGHRHGRPQGRPSPVFRPLRRDTTDSQLGMTAGCVDNADLFLEEVDVGGRKVRDGDGFVECALRTEQIRVKGSKAVLEEILETPRGPVIGPALDGETRAISLRAVWLDALPVEGLLRAHESRSFDEFRGFFAAWPGPSLNMAYADESGTIGWQLVGQAPRRRSGLGDVPLPGWEARRLGRRAASI